MDKLEELEFAHLLFGGVAAMVILSGTVIFFAVLYQRKLYTQQIRLHQLEVTRQKDILESVVRSQERERDRIARDLHDEVGASLSTAKLFVTQIVHESTLDEMKMLAQHASGILSDMVQDVRQIAQNLSPVVLKNVGLSDAIHLLLNRIEATGLRIDRHLEVRPEVMEEEKQLALYRIIQEVLGNVVKHAAANQLSLWLGQQNNAVTLRIEDDGRGFEYGNAQSSNRTSMGMGSIQARAGLLDARLHIDSSIGRGTCIELTFQV